MKLKAVLANRHVYDGQINGKPIRLLLCFDCSRGLRLKGGANGQNMVIDRNALDTPYAMGEYGSVDQADVTDSLFPKLRNAEISDIQELVLSGIPIGITVNRAVGKSFHIWNDGDEFHWGSDSDLRGHDWLDGEFPKAGQRIEV